MCIRDRTWNGSVCTGTKNLLPWNNGSTNWTVTGNTSTVTGEANSISLAALADAGAPYNAADACINLVQDGHSDWYLPASAELYVLYTNRSVIANLGGESHWSSTDTSTADNAGTMTLSNGLGYARDKNEATHTIRCVRK